MANGAPFAGPSTLASDPLPVVKVNNAHLGEMKSALDDVVRKVRHRDWASPRSSPRGSSHCGLHSIAVFANLQYLMDAEYTPSLLHTTVHLSLGYTSVLLALGSMLYSLRVS